MLASAPEQPIRLFIGLDDPSRGNLLSLTLTPTEARECLDVLELYRASGDNEHLLALKSLTEAKVALVRLPRFYPAIDALPEAVREHIQELARGTRMRRPLEPILVDVDILTDLPTVGLRNVTVRVEPQGIAWELDLPEPAFTVTARWVDTSTLRAVMGRALLDEPEPSP